MRKLGIVVGRPSIQPILKYLPDHLTNHFLRGFYDGDGTVGYRKSIRQWRIGFCGDYDILAWVRHVIARDIDFNPDHRILKHNTAELHYLTYTGNVQSETLRNYLYANATVWLPRKKKRADKIVPLGMERDRDDLGRFAKTR